MKPSSVVGVTRYYWTKAEFARRLADLRNFGGFLIGIAQSRQLAAFLDQLVGDDYHTVGKRKRAAETAGGPVKRTDCMGGIGV